MTTNQISWVIAIVGFIAIGTAFVAWDKAVPEGTPAQKREDTYARCVSNKYINNRPIEECNLIKP